jgi:3-oxo-5-alpha-steroid 4-dehydrogenase 1
MFWHDNAMSTFLWIQFALCPLVFFWLMYVTAPYGRHFKPGWGLTLPNRAAWFVMEIPAVLVITYLVLGSEDGRTPSALVPLSLWLFHYLYRTFIFPFLMRPSHNTFPISLVFFALFFNILNGLNNGTALLDSAQNDTPFITVHFIAGVLIFVAGFLMHSFSDSIIRQLRRPGESGYGIPYKGLFRWTSNPNYLGEMIQWTGWAILCWSFAGAAFALFTVCNLLPRAIANHRWYLEKFPHYPSNRKILVPGLY